MRPQDNRRPGAVGPNGVALVARRDLRRYWRKRLAELAAFSKGAGR